MAVSVVWFVTRILAGFIQADPIPHMLLSYTTCCTYHCETLFLLHVFDPECQVRELMVRRKMR